MKNEALERLWRMLNIADIEGKFVGPQHVSLLLEEVKNAIEEEDQLLDAAREHGWSQSQ